MDFTSGVATGSKVMVVWGELQEGGEALQAFVEELQKQVGSQPRVAVENSLRVGLAGHPKSSFNAIFSGCVGLATVEHSLDLLGTLGSLLAPGGKLTLAEALPSSTAPSSLSSRLVLAGLPSVSQPNEIDASHPLASASKAKMGEVDVFLITATKPMHEVGASRMLSFAKPAAVPKAEPKASVWTLEDMDDDTVELVDDSTLLEEEDLVKVDPSTLRVCGTTGKRKACKDCSCGLREELADGKEPTTKSVNSSCGSCYLGDAFRCGSCPYLGMPAFKPGEKIQLSDRQLNPDLREVA